MSGLRRWLLTTDHRDIGTLYLGFALLMFFTGGALAMVVRAELYQPGLQVVQPHLFNQLATMHALVMIFGAVMPAFVGLANRQIPLLIGAPEMAFPRLNNLSFWLLPAAFALLLATPFMEGGGPAFGWTFYAPLSTKFAPQSTDYFVFAIHLLGLSSIVGAMNIIATIFNLRRDGLRLMDMPLFVWCWLVTAFLLIAAMPVLAAAATMVLADRYFGTSFFDAAGGGDPVLFQHLFWFFGHPEVYIMILPAFGIVSQVLPTFARKPLFGHHAMVGAVMAIAVLAFTVWAHHMFTVGMPVAGELFFMYATMLIAVPTGLKIFNWISTLYHGSLSFETPMLFALGFIALFTIGGFSGLMSAVVPADYQYHDTYFVVAHLHYVLVTGAVFGIYAGVYYWLPLWTGRRYSERLGKLHFWLSVVAANVTFFPMHFLGLAGMPRRIPDYALQFADFNRITSLGAFAFGASQLLFLFIVWRALRAGEPVSGPVWEGEDGPEWREHHTAGARP